MSSGAGFSGTPLYRKLGIKEGGRVALVGAPATFEELLGDLPAGVQLVRGPRGRRVYELVLLFVADAASLRARLPRALERTDPYGALWVCWPKKRSPRFRDLTEDGVREAALAAGVVDNKVCAIDEDWSGLRLVTRLKDRPAR